MTITNFLTEPWLYSLAINVGDTVVWVNQQPLDLGTNYVESYGGEWKSPPMSEGDSFSFTFTEAGFYAYRTGLKFGWAAAAAVSQAGTVTVVGWTGAPPAVTINFPIDDSVVRAGTPVRASVTNAENLAQVEFFADSSLVGTATNAPYGIYWQPAGPPAQGRYYVLMAKAIDRLGGVFFSQPVNISVEPNVNVWGPRLLPTGEVLFFYNSIAGRASFYIVSSDDPAFTSYTTLARVLSPGAFVDERVRAEVQRRFYTVVPGP